MKFWVAITETGERESTVPPCRTGNSTVTVGKTIHYPHGLAPVHPFVRALLVFPLFGNSVMRFHRFPLSVVFFCFLFSNRLLAWAVSTCSKVSGILPRFLVLLQQLLLLVMLFLLPQARHCFSPLPLRSTSRTSAILRQLRFPPALPPLAMVLSIVPTAASTSTLATSMTPTR